MKISKVAQAIVLISVLTGIIGCVAIARKYYFYGIGLIIAAVLIYGFAYIVQAAYVYLHNQPDDEDEKDEENRQSEIE